MSTVAWVSPPPASAQEAKQEGPDLAELSEDDRAVLERGEYSGGKIAASGLLGTVVGFGSGHAVQGRFRERGWIFAAGEGGGLGLAFTGLILNLSVASGGDASAATAGVALGGLAIAVGFHLWEIGDVWSYPVVHNRRYRRLKAKSGDPKWSLHLTPNAGGATAGLAVRF